MKTVLKIVTKTLCLTFVFVSLWLLLSPYFRTERIVDGDQFRILPKNTVDVLALGSSHMQYAFNPATFYVETGYYSYVLGSACQPMTISYNFLKEALKTQNPEVVIIDVFTLLPDKNICESDGIYYRAIQQLTGLNRIEAALTVPNQEVRFDYMFDLIMNHGNWKDIDFSKTNLSVTEVNPGLGYVNELPDTFLFQHLILYEAKEKIELTPEEKKSIDALISLCDKEGIELIFIKTPYIIDQENQDKLQAIWDYLEEKDAEYLDLLNGVEEYGWVLSMHGNTWHNNAWGAEIVTTYLANYIKEKGYVNNHQTNEVYEHILGEMKKRNAKNLMYSAQIDIYILLNHATKYPNTTLVKYTAKNLSIGPDETQLMNKAGIRHDFENDISTDYFAIIENGKVIVESNECIDYSYNGHKIHISNDGIIIDGEHYDEGEMSFIFSDNDFTWLNFIPIDYASRFFWKNGCNSWVCDEKEQ